MKKKKRRLFESFRYICLVSLIVLGLITIVATGGGGGGGGGGGVEPPPPPPPQEGSRWDEMSWDQDEWA